MRQSTFHTAKEAEYLGYLEASLSNSYGYNEEGITSGVKKLFGKKEVVKPSFLQRHGGKIAAGFGGLSLGSGGALLGSYAYMMSKAGNMMNIGQDIIKIARENMSPAEIKQATAFINEYFAGLNKLAGVFREHPEYKKVITNIYNNPNDIPDKYFAEAGDLNRKLLIEVKNIWDNLSTGVKEYTMVIFKELFNYDGKFNNLKYDEFVKKVSNTLETLIKEN